MDAQSKATMTHLLPELASILAAVTPDDALLVRLEDRWDTFVDGRALRTMTADFAPSEDSGGLASLRAQFGERIGGSFRHVEFEPADSRDVFERDRAAVRIWRVVTRLAQGYELDAIRVDVKRTAPGACPLVFSEPHRVLRARIGDGAAMFALREHAMDLEALARIAAVTEREGIEGLEVPPLEDVRGAGFRSLSNGDLAVRQASEDVELRATISKIPGGIAFKTAMIRSGDQAPGAS